MIINELEGENDQLHIDQQYLKWVKACKKNDKTKQALNEKKAYINLQTSTTECLKISKLTEQAINFISRASKNWKNRLNNCKKS